MGIWSSHWPPAVHQLLERISIDFRSVTHYLVFIQQRCTSIFLPTESICSSLQEQIEKDLPPWDNNTTTVWVLVCSVSSYWFLAWHLFNLLVEYCPIDDKNRRRGDLVDPTRNESLLACRRQQSRPLRHLQIPIFLQTATTIRIKMKSLQCHGQITKIQLFTITFRNTPSRFLCGRQIVTRASKNLKSMACGGPCYRKSQKLLAILLISC